ncbi:THO complex subunit 4B-like [Zingiber officinale]|uniref:THO complex subunit 4B-like n=1 Tax=Zingiber officinale TaxID=94328 RepID=UPI001C4A8B83|nr:THO complex subunit 4B-like [Zingiber officinale]
MSGTLDMSLDDIIKSSKKTASGGRGRGREHDMYSAAQVGGFPAPTARASSIETGTKLYISNLEFGVSNEDIKVLFFTF